jgi:hypothetical protein
MANEMVIVHQRKFTADCACRLDVRYVLQRNNQPVEGETLFEPTDDAVYKIVVTNTGNGYAKDVKALTWLTVAPPGGETVDVPDDLRIIPHGLLGRFRPRFPPTGEAAKFPDDLTPVNDDLNLEVFVKNARQHDLVPFPGIDPDRFIHYCNVVRFGDIPPGLSKVACLTIISEGAPEQTRYKINLFFKFDCCELVQVPVVQCRQVEYGAIEGKISED